MKLVHGGDLNNKQVTEVFAAFVHRHLSGMNDRNWLLTHAFYIKNDGHLALKRAAQPSCMADK